MKKNSPAKNSKLLLVSLLFCACTQKPFIPGEEFSLAEKVQTIPIENRMFDPDWNIWCGSMTKGFDGKYHLFYSRWPQESGHEAWVSHSEIAYAVAEKPEGPYKHVNVALGAVDSILWDGAMTHNPCIVTANGKYYLYYIGTKGSLLSPSEWDIPYSTNWWKRRNTQRIGVAVADNPAGPWLRFGQPVLGNNPDSTAFDAMCVTNPAVCVGRNGKMVMLYKAVCKNGTVQGGDVRFSVAFADNPTGPFVKTNQLIFEPLNKNDRMVAEDPYIWYEEKTDQYYAIVRDVVRQFTGTDSGGLALMVSSDAIHWKETPYPKVLPAILKWSDGSQYNADKQSVERPCVYRDEKGIPRLLFGTFGVEVNGVKRHHSFNAWIPFGMDLPSGKSASE